MLNSLLWQGHLMTPSSTEVTGQPWWVQIAVNALNAPEVGWVTTYFSSRITPPPTGTFEVATVALAAVAPELAEVVLDAAEDDAMDEVADPVEPAPAPVSDDFPHAASARDATATDPPTPADRRTARRSVTNCRTFC